MKHRIAVIAGDGIGQEVMPEGLRVLQAARHKFGLELEFQIFDWANCDYYLQHGQMMPDNWREQLSSLMPFTLARLAGRTRCRTISLVGSLLKFRREFDQYANVRPVRLMPGIPCPLAGKQVGDIDFMVVRENTEGEYSSIGGRIFEGTERETVVQESIFTRHGTDRILKFAFEMAQNRPKST
jgi:tartrate dehydrogenase/decarboxylase/D-malate dehydrogenase